MIYLDENGITIKASKEAVIGEEYELNGENYKVVDEEILREMVKNLSLIHISEPTRRS